MRKGYDINFEETFRDLQVLDNKKYWYDTRKLESCYQVMQHCKETMKDPVMYQIEFGINPEEFNKSSFIKTLKREWLKDWNKYEKIRLEKGLRSRKTPKFHYIYTFEFKEKAHWKSRQTVINYHHCHFMFIVDVRDKTFGVEEFSNRSINALKKIKGIKTGVNPDTSRQENPKINYRKMPNPTFGAKFPLHSLKEDFEDAFIRVSYLTKDTQREGVIGRSSFDSSIRTVNKEKKKLCSSV